MVDELVADPFGYLGDDGVSEAAQSVHPVGNPMSHSTHTGFNCPLSPARPTASVSSIDAPSCLNLSEHSE